jgi:aminoglycoside phosphotransferase family enzyme
MLDQDLEEKVRFLASPGVLGAPGEVPELRETHMSWVFLTRDHAFKLKKPVRFEYLDFSTCAAREEACKAELALNRTLAPDIYLRLARLGRAPNGAFELDGAGAASDWLVVMRRLPQSIMLDTAIKTGAVGIADIEALAHTLIAFYRRAPPGGVAPEVYAKRFESQLAADRKLLCDPRFDIDRQRAAEVLNALDAALAAQRGELLRRAEAKCILEGHGDLRPEHICLSTPVRIIDRIEFNRDLRLVDPFDELAFLDMECALAGADWIGPLILACAKRELTWPPEEKLIVLYGALRASLRARLSLAHLLDPSPREPAKWAPLAARYIDFAARALSLHRQAER